MPVKPAKEFIMNNFSSSGENSGFSVMGRDELESANGEFSGCYRNPIEELAVLYSLITKAK
jgi:hypothetical protein